MAASKVVLAVLGLVALLTTAAVFILGIANAQTHRSTSTVQTAAAVAAGFEGVLLVSILLLLFTSFQHSTYRGSGKLNALWFPLCLAVIVLATVSSIVVLVVLSKETENTNILGGPEMNYLVGTAIALGFAFTTQMAFVVVYFVGSRFAGSDDGRSQHAEGGRFVPQMHMKSVPYDHTMTSTAEPKQAPSDDFQSPPESSGRRSMAGTMSSIRSSFSHKVRPMSSKTRLLSIKSNRSLRSNASRQGRRQTSFDASPDLDEGFDSWDTSSVYTNNRHVLDIPAAPRFLGNLETIPASPTVSRSPSPGYPLDLEPPRRSARRNRSYSPVPRPPPTLTLHGSSSELHIHPLFRADSPTPPPAATLGTSIVASPDAARTFSVKTLNRMRSGSLPAASSPLIRQGSYESMKGKSPSPTSGRLSPISVEPIEERQMTPPLPEWIMNAGSRTSLIEYHSRKVRDRDGHADSGLGIMQ